MYIKENTKYDVLVDEQGIMLSPADVRWLMARCEAYFKHSPLELEAIGRKTVEENHPRMALQFNWDYFKD